MACKRRAKLAAELDRLKIDPLAGMTEEQIKALYVRLGQMERTARVLRAVTGGNQDEVG